MPFIFESNGSFNNLEKFLKKAMSNDISSVLEKCGREGVSALAAATPLDSGETKNSWSFKVTNTRGAHGITWMNNHKTVDGDPIAIILQYGHGTGTGGYVQGRDYINPAMRPVFDSIADKVWKAVTSV
jgi:Bacteriophage HK97-gp10, putative tail-component